MRMPVGNQAVCCKRSVQVRFTLEFFRHIRHHYCGTRE